MSLIGVISDTHDNLDKVRAAVHLFNRLDAELVVHCGDFVAQFVLVELSKLKSRLHGVLGNCDGDPAALHKRAQEFGFRLASGLDCFTYKGKRLCISHQPVSPAPDCDFYLHGHTHKPYFAPGPPVVVNPGEACGWLSGRATVATLDVETGRVEFYDL